MTIKGLICAGDDRNDRSKAFTVPFFGRRSFSSRENRDVPKRLSNN